MHAQFAEGLHFSAFHLQTCSRHGNDEMHAYQVLSPCVQALGRLRSEEVILKRGNLLLFTNMYCCLLMLVISMTMHIRLSKFHGFIYFSF